MTKAVILGLLMTLGLIAPVSAQSYEDMIRETCAVYGCNANYLISVAQCESGMDQSAVAYNPASGNYTYGIFQIDAMWGGDQMSAQQQIEFAAEHLGKDIYWVCQ